MLKGKDSALHSWTTYLIAAVLQMLYTVKHEHGLEKTMVFSIFRPAVKLLDIISLTSTENPITKHPITKHYLNASEGSL